jgi:uronate dehydrogenase
MLERLLITGAAGGLGRMARQRLAHLAKVVRLSDIVDLGPAAENEEIVVCDLADAQAVNALVAGCDGVVHLGGISVEDVFSKIMNANLLGIYNLYEAVRKNGSPRVLLASSNHVVGFHKQTDKLNADSPMRPDGLYGVSKCFAENMATLYHDKFSVETARLRIGSSFAEPWDHRSLSTWLSYDDFVSFAECVFSAPRLGCPVVYGVSDNDTIWWDNSAVSYLGWKPKDTSRAFRDKIYAEVPMPDKDAPESVYQGGKFAADGIHEE